MRASDTSIHTVLTLLAALLIMACGTTRESAREQGTQEHSRKAATSPSWSEGKDTSQESVTPGTVPMRVGASSVQVEVAADSVSRARGLSGRTALAPDTGMLFIYAEADSRSFWMKNTLIPLDIAFIGNDRKIIEVISLEPPAPGCTDEEMPRAQSSGAARYVLEMNRGWFAAHGCGAGTLLDFSPALERVVEEVEF